MRIYLAPPPSAKKYTLAFHTALQVIWRRAIMKQPFAVEVFEHFLKGESIREMADELQIPADRLELRLRAAALYLGHQAKSSRLNCLHATAIITVIPTEPAQLPHGLGTWPAPSISSTIQP